MADTSSTPSKVWVVEYCWSYEGCAVQAVYATEEEAKKHPRGGDDMKVREFEILTQAPDDWNMVL